MSDSVSGPADERPSRLTRLLVVAAWIVLALAANVFLALNPSREAGSASVTEKSSTSTANNLVAQSFPGTGTDAIAYLVLDGRDPLGPSDTQYYDAAVSALRADSKHVGSVLDWWSDPLMEPLGAGKDGRSGMAVLWLRGEAGSARAAESLDAARSVVRRLPPKSGLRARITAPTIVDGAAVSLVAWQAAAVVAATAVIALLVLLRVARTTVRGVLVTAGLALAVAWPMAAVFGLFSGTLAAVLMIGVIVASARWVASQDRRGYRDLLPALTLPAVSVLAVTAPLLLARTPAVHAVGVAALGVAVALAACLTLLPRSITGARQSNPDDTRPQLSMTRRTAAVALVLAVCALPVLATRWGVGDAPARAGNAHFVPSDRLPDVVMVRSTHDLRDPSGLIAVDAVSRRLMEIPGVRKVQSAAWPGGVPWTDASLSSSAGRLSDQLDRQAATFVPQVTAIKTLKAVLDQVSGSVNQLETSVTTGVGGLNQMQQAINSVVSGTHNIKDTATQVSGYLDPVRGWMGGVADCAADVLCSALRKAIDPFDRVIADVSVLSDGAARIAAGSTRAIGALTATPGAVAQLRSSLDQLRSFVPTLETTIESTIPQVVQLSAFLRNLSIDFADTGQGGFYLPRKALADPSYQHVRQTMFSADGTAARLLVYSDATGLDAAPRATQLDTAVASATKYGSLVDSEVTISGGAQVAAAVRGGLTHDAILLAVTMLVVVALIAAWRGLRAGVMVGAGLLGCWLAGLGVTTAIWQYLLHRSVDAAAAPASFAVLAACGVPCLVAALAPARPSVAPLAAAGWFFGAGLVLVGPFGLLGQMGAVVAVGLVALAISVQFLMRASVQVDGLVPLGQGDLDRAGPEVSAGPDQSV